MLRLRIHALVAAATVVLLSGCASSEKPIDPWTRDKDVVLSTIKTGQEQQVAFSQQLQELTRQFIKLQQTDKKSESQLAAMEASIQAMREQVAKRPIHRAKNKGKQNNIAPPTNLQKQLKQKISRAERDIDHTMRRVEHKPIASITEPAETPPTAVTATAAKKPEPAKKPTFDPTDEKNSYTAAYLALKSGRFEESGKQFEKHLTKFPGGTLTDQALYWLGESYLAQKKDLDAEKVFKKLLRHHATSSKFAATLLRLGMIYQRSGHKGDAKAAYLQLIQNQPNSSAAEQARSRLNELK
ncbi:MAG: tol-pal system protein YbgF [Mariprofundales bacterium]